MIGRTLFKHKTQYTSFFKHVEGKATAHKLAIHSNAVSWMSKTLLLSNAHELACLLIILLNLGDDSSNTSLDNLIVVLYIVGPL